MDQDIGRQVGSRIRALREQQGLTQEQLADLVEKHPDTLSLIERGRSVPSLKTLYVIAAALGVEASELIPPIGKTDARRDQLLAEITAIVGGLPSKHLALARDQLASLAKLR